MTISAMLAALSDTSGLVALVAVAAVILFFAFVYAMAKRYAKVGPNEVLIISGRGKGGRGFRIVQGGGTFIWPIVERAEVLSLELMTLDVKTPEVYTVIGVPVLVDGVAQIKVKGDVESIATAAEQFLSKDQAEIMRIALQTVEGHLRAILGTMTVEEIYKNRDAFAQRVQEVAATDMANMGLEIVSFTLRDIRDSEGYLDALGKPRTAQVKRDAIVGQAEADRDAMIKSAQASQAGQEAKFIADTKIAEAQRDFESKRAAYQATVNQAKAQADLAYDLQKFKTTQAVKAEEVQVQVIEKERQIDVQEKEILRRAKELEATVQRPADAERYRIQQLAEAERFRKENTAAGEGAAARLMGEGDGKALEAKGRGEAAAIEARGLAEAQAIRARGLAEAEAMEKKAAAWKAYNEAAIAQMLIEKLPELARAIAEPLARIDRIVLINNGPGDAQGIGASRISREVVDVLAQLPAAVEAVTGQNFKDLLANLPRFVRQAGAEGDAKTSPDAKTSGDAKPADAKTPPATRSQPTPRPPPT
jgi:flotillin